MNLEKYGLKRVSIESIDLRSCFTQARPNDPITHLFENDSPLMTGSPHVEFATAYWNKGEKWLHKHWKNMRYGKMLKIFGKNNFPVKFINLCESIKKGYRKHSYKDCFITLLEKPFAYTRFNRNVELNYVPEVWSGHHRIGILISLQKFIVDVEVAEDQYPGSYKSYGKIQGLCIAK